jgi:cytoskeletal protein CcmA (bactofilin family)
VTPTSDVDNSDPIQHWVEKLRGGASSGDPLDAEGQHLPAEALRKILVDPQLVADPRGLWIQNAHITERLGLEHIYFAHPLHLTDCTLDAPTDLSGATIKELDFSGSHVQDLNLIGIEVHGHVIIATRSVVNGTVNALGARINGQLSLAGATIGNPKGQALILDTAEITGGVYADRFIADGEIRAAGARINGQLSLAGATIRNPDGTALNLERAEVTGGVLADGFIADGEIRAAGARINGQLSLAGATIRNPNGHAVILERAEITGGVLAERFIADGEVRAAGAQIHGQLSLAGATIRNPNGHAVILDSAEITGGVFAERFIADGEVRALGAQIHGQLNLDGATIRNATGNALMLDSAEITGEVFANKLTADGQVSATNAHIEKNFELLHATLRNPTGYSLTFAGASIARLILEPSVNEGAVRLYRAKIGDLITAELPPVPLIASGWEVSDIHGPLRESVNLAMNWMDTNSTIGTPDKKKSVQPWYAMAAAYERNGDPASARKLRYAAAKKVTAQSSGFTKVAGWLYDGLVGHGYHPLRALGWLVAVVLAGWLVVALSQEDIVPANMKDAIAAANTQPAATGIAAPPFTARTPCSSHPAYPCEESFTFAFNALAPASVGSPDAYWTVKHEAYWLTVVLEMLKIFGWVLAALLIAGVTGLLRKT